MPKKLSLYKRIITRNNNLLMSVINSDDHNFSNPEKVIIITTKINQLIEKNIELQEKIDLLHKEKTKKRVERTDVELVVSFAKEWGILKEMSSLELENVINGICEREN